VDAHHPFEDRKVSLELGEPRIIRRQLLRCSSRFVLGRTSGDERVVGLREHHSHSCSASASLKLGFGVGPAMRCQAITFAWRSSSSVARSYPNIPESTSSVCWPGVGTGPM